jgi:hypothetical protein
VQLQYEYPFTTTGNYTPGKEFDGALGIFYNFGHVGPLEELAPMVTVPVRFGHVTWESNPTN